MRTVHLLHGIPGSGKTSFAKQLELKANTVRLSHDEWMVALFGSDPAMDQWERYSARIEAQLWVMAERFDSRRCRRGHGFRLLVAKVTG